MGKKPKPENSASGDARQLPHGEQPSGAPTPTQNPGWHPEEQQHRTKERRHWKITNISTAIAALGGVASTGLALGALINSQNAAESAWQAVREAKRQADATESQLAISKDTEIRQLRAYLSIAHGPIETTDTDVAVEVLISHGGGTPAYKIRFDAIIEVAPYLLNQTKLNNPATPAMMIGIPRYQYAILYHGSQPIKEIIKMPQPAFEAIRLVKSSDYSRGPIYAYYLHGRVRYVDIFDIEHPYDFCFVFRGNRGPEGSEEGCEPYNKPG